MKIMLYLCLLCVFVQPLYAQIVSIADNGVEYQNNLYEIIDVDEGYELIIKDVSNGINIAEISDVVIGAKNVVVENSVLDFRGVNLAELKNINLSLNGRVILKVGDVSGLTDGVLFENVDGNPMLFLLSENKDNLLTNIVRISNGKLYVIQEREEDYDKILDDNVTSELEDYVNNLQDSTIKDSLIDKIDSVDDINRVLQIIDSSVRFNSRKLVEPVRILDSVNKNKFSIAAHGAGAFVLIGNEFDAYGLNLNFAFGDKKKTFANFGLQATKLAYASDLDAFDAQNYSMNFELNAGLWRGLFLDARFAVGVTHFDVGDVLYDKQVYNNPWLMSGYAVVDMGYGFDITDSLLLSPFVGLDFTVYDTDGLSENNLSIRYGFETLYAYEIMGLHYKYGARFVVTSDDEFMASLVGDYWSVADLIGAGLEMSAIYMYDKVSYQISARFNIEF